ncbi:MAG: hypothetical protein CMF41_03690 [Legionellales bacterium]|mgnify:CR=1 FL=1|nr:hypothetical protein [Legionellales bacterium]OUX65191.1 MAG: hypothetical protein CBE41_01975 [Gammaproteobacteria bacterium TMED281]
MKIAIIGAGTWGMNHVKTLIHMNVDIAVFEPSKINKEKIFKLFPNIKFLDKMNDAIKFDAVIITAPTPLHEKLGSFFLSHKVPCFIEKPLAFKTEEAKSLVDLSKKNKTLVAVGHIEHFNPAFIKLKEYVSKDENIFEISINRHGMARPGFDTSVDVIFDLMIHDIGMMIDLLGTQDAIMNINAFSVPCSTDPFGFVKALIQFQSGRIVNLSSSRISHQKQRQIEVQSLENKYIANLIDQTTQMYTHNEVRANDKLSSRKSLLELELDDFINAVTHKNKLTVPISLAYNAVKVAGIIKGLVMKNNILQTNKQL